MIKEIIVYPRDFIRFLISSSRKICPAGNWALISIYSEPESKIFEEQCCSPNSKTEAEKRGCVGILQPRFSDISATEYEYVKPVEPSLRLFTDEIAKDIINFINNFNKKEDVSTLLINCAAGVSRSGAVGLFACRYLGLNETKFLERNNTIHPNRYVLQTLNRVSGLREDYEKLWRNL